VWDEFAFPVAEVGRWRLEVSSDTHHAGTEGARVSTSKARPKVILVGLDGMIPEQVLRYAGRVPEIARLLEDGFFSPAIPALPTDTPTNWTTIATGAWSGTHGITGFGVHPRGAALGEYLPTFNSRLCQAEYFWQAAERQGKRCLLLNYPTAFPLSLREGVVIGGDGLSSRQWTVRWPELISSWRDARDVKPLVLQPARGWKNMPAGWRVLYEGLVDLSAQRQFGWGAAGATDEGLTKGGDRDRRYVLAIMEGQTSSVLFARSRDAAHPIWRLRKGEWSDWVQERLSGRQCLRRYKLVDLDARRKRISIYGTTGAKARGWGYPKGIEREILRQAGAYVEALELEPDSAFRADWFGREDTGAILDVMQLQADWLVNAAAHLTRTRDWDVMFAQYHAPDGTSHDLLGDLEHRHPRVRRQADRVLGEVYGMLFRMVEAIRDRCADDNTLLCVVSDHGNMPVRHWVNMYRPLLDEGWTRFVRNRGTGKWGLDPARSKVWACTSQPGIWVNLKGREKHGCVKPGAEYERLRTAIIERLQQLVHPETGEPAFALVGRREDFEGLGVWGERFADVLAVCNPYFLAYGGAYPTTNVDAQTVEAYAKGPAVMPIADAPGGEVLHNLTAVHWTLPWASVGYASNRGCLLQSGPGVASNRRAARVNLVDVAPTLAHFLGMRPPAQCEGRVIHEAFTT